MFHVLPLLSNIARDPNLSINTWGKKMSLDLPDSQLSGLSLELSQETANQIMQVTLGWKAESDT